MRASLFCMTHEELTLQFECRNSWVELFLGLAQQDSIIWWCTLSTNGLPVLCVSPLNCHLQMTMSIIEILLNSSMASMGLGLNSAYYVMCILRHIVFLQFKGARMPIFSSVWLDNWLEYFLWIRWKQNKKAIRVFVPQFFKSTWNISIVNDFMTSITSCAFIRLFTYC